MRIMIGLKKDLSVTPEQALFILRQQLIIRCSGGNSGNKFKNKVKFPSQQLMQKKMTIIALGSKPIDLFGVLVAVIKLT